MAEYVDGFVLPIQKDRLDAYKELAAGSATIWKSHGALEYRENVLERERVAGYGQDGELSAGLFVESSVAD